MVVDNNIKVFSQYLVEPIPEINTHEYENGFFSEVLETKNGQKTVRVSTEEGVQLLHSKYDPQSEAKRFISQFKGYEDDYEHVLFYGVGMGYHIKEFMSKYPSFTFSIYEPKIEIFNHFVNHISPSELPLSRLKEIFFETSRGKAKDFLNSKIQNLGERVLVVTLPSYERVFKNEYLKFVEDFKSALELKRHTNLVNKHFSYRWTLNSLLNLPETIASPNILQGFERFFKDKPVIIVSAGPSLEEEYENLKKIKEQKLAYIFAVGSANRALIANDILPDAVCTYDPQPHNFAVYSPLLEKGIDTIPMIFGTSVGFETIKMYKGPKLHMITNQDTISPFYLKNNLSTSQFVQDSPSIAAITFQMVSKLGCNPIIFVGQNLAFRNNEFYSKDVRYKDLKQTYENFEEQNKIILVEDVNGNRIESTPSFLIMKENIEWYISNSSNLEVWNTTRGGAEIKGTIYKPLDEIINEKLTSSVVNANWYEQDNYYGKDYIYSAVREIEQSIKDFEKDYSDLNNHLMVMKQSITSKNEKRIYKNITKFNTLMRKITNTYVHHVFLQPINREYYQALSIGSANIRKQLDVIKKTELILKSFPKYLERCKETLEQIKGSIYKVHQSIRNNTQNNSTQFYPCDCGIFNYIGYWNKCNFGPGETIDFRIHKYITNTRESLIRFNFTGTVLRIFGSIRKEFVGKIKLTIDGNSEIISLDVEKESCFYNNIILEKNNLSEGSHRVEIESIEEKVFEFFGVEICKSGQIYHVDEVKSFEDLQIGKRIRCTYNAVYNNLGEFSNIGKGIGSFIPTESTPYPKGDFYFIMVDEINGNKFLLADRNVQSFISYDALNSAEVTGEIGKKINIDKSFNVTLKLLSGGVNSMDDTSDWDKYIGTCRDKSTTDLNEYLWNYKYSGSWTNCSWEENSNAKVIRGLNTCWTAALTFSTDMDKGFRPLIII